MLVLSRKEKERIIFTIGGLRIEVMVLDIRGDKVRLGCLAPPEVTIHREEIQIRVEKGLKGGLEPVK